MNNDACSRWISFLSFLTRPARFYLDGFSFGGFVHLQEIVNLDEHLRAKRQRARKSAPA